jgi:hypothetical protein
LPNERDQREQRGQRRRRRLRRRRVGAQRAPAAAVTMPRGDLLCHLARVRRLPATIIALLLVASCSYQAPDTGDVLFRCDANRGCPSEMSCVGGVCLRGIADGDGVVCGGATCPVGQRCCIDGINPPRCLANIDTCDGEAKFCDGREDCGSELCCAPIGRTAARCETAATCLSFSCLDHNDCPSTAPNCCLQSRGIDKLCEFAPCK